MIATSAGHVVGTALGLAILAALVFLACRTLLRRADAEGLLAPVAVGLALRVGLMLAIHLVSLIRDEAGLMFLDDRTYLLKGMLIADAWRAGDAVNPGTYDYAGTYLFGYQAISAGAFLLVEDIFAGKVVNVLASGAVVLLTALIAGRIWGDEAKRRTAWIAALAPGLIWWSAPLLKEAVSTFLLCAAILCLLSLGSRRAIMALVATLIALALVRVAGGLAFVFTASIVVPWLAFAHRHELDLRRFTRVGMCALGIAFLGVLGLSGGDIPGYVSSYASLVDSMIGEYRDSGLALLPVEIAKAFVSPYPWTFDAGTHNWDMGLYPGMWLWYGLYPLAAIGIVRHRRKPEIWLLVGVMVSFLAINAFSAGFIFRQRSSIDPLVIVLAIGGLSSWRAFGRSFAGAFGVVAVFAALQSSFDPITVIPIVIAAAAIALVSKRRLSASPLALTPREPLRESLRAVTSRRWRLVASGRDALRAASVRPATEQIGPRLKRRHGVALTVVAILLGLFALPGVRTEAQSSVLLDEDFAAQTRTVAKSSGDFERNGDGWVIGATGFGSVRIPLADVSNRAGDRDVIRIWANGSGLEDSHVGLYRNGRLVESLGEPAGWVGKRFDLRTLGVRGKGLQVRVTAVASGTPLLVLDKLQVARTKRADTLPDAGRGLVAVWFALLLAACACLLRARRHHLIVGVLAGLLVGLSWPDVVSAAALPIEPGLASAWDSVRDGGYVFSGDGPLWGASSEGSHLTAQLLHLVRPLVGTGAAAAPAAALVLAVIALVAVWWTVNRIAGRTGAIAATGALLLLDVFRVNALGSPDVAAFVFAGTVYVTALDHFLAHRTPRALLGLSAATALAALAEPLTLPGGLAVLILGAVRWLPSPGRARALGIAAALLLVLLVPNRLNVATVTDRGLLGDVETRARVAYSLDAGAAGSGGMTAYVFGEHSLGEVTEGTAAGGEAALDALGVRGESRIFGLAAVLLLIAGGAFALLATRSRRVLLAPVVLVLVPVLFLVDRGVASAAATGALWLPALLAGAALLVVRVTQRRA